MPSRSSRTTAAGCTSTRVCGRAASLCLRATAYAGVSQMALWYIGGLLKHARAMSAIIAPTTNSYKRLVPDTNPGESGVTRAGTGRRRAESPCTRPARRPSAWSSGRPILRRIRISLFAAMTMAGLDGVLNKIDPGRSSRQGHLRSLSGRDEPRSSMPGSLEEALDCMENDHEFLLKAMFSPKNCWRRSSTTSGRTKRTRFACGAPLRIRPVLRH